jgi:hypothetical protein
MAGAGISHKATQSYPGNALQKGPFHIVVDLIVYDANFGEIIFPRKLYLHVANPPLLLLPRLPVGESFRQLDRRGQILVDQHAWGKGMHKLPMTLAKASRVATPVMRGSTPAPVGAVVASWWRPE